MEIFGMIFHQTTLTLLLYEKESFQYIFCFFHNFYIYCYVGTLKSAIKFQHIACLFRTLPCNEKGVSPVLLTYFNFNK